jgi:hypothetical protein
MMENMMTTALFAHRQAHFAGMSALRSFQFGLIGLAVGALAACGSGSSSSSTSGNTIASAVSTAYPTSVAMESPTAADEGTSPTAWLTPKEPARSWQQFFAWERLLGIQSAHAATLGSTPAFDATVERINDILAGGSLTTTHFNVNRLLRTHSDADCYGPTMKVQNHPDNTGAAATTLPSGDLGIWDDTDSVTSSACAASELNARMRGVAARSSQAMIALAMLVKKAHLTGSGIPTVGNSVNLVASMPSISGVTWSAATLSQPTSGNYQYTLQFTFTDASSLSHMVDLSLSHSNTSASVYSGLMKYAITNKFTGGNCPGSGSKDVTLVGTLRYNRTSSTVLDMSHRSGQYCGAGSTAGSLASDRGATYDGSGELDPDSTLNGGTGKGWGDNFSRFGGSFDPSTQAGRFLLAWQAGPSDSKSRVLQAVVSGSFAAGRSGLAFFGFAAPVSPAASFTGDIQGMICNWAGPGANGTLNDYAQKQSFAQAASGNRWTVSGTSQVRYAPKNDCVYAGTTQWYDRNRNNTFDETNAELQVASSDGNFLMGKGGSASISAAITAAGYTKPALY